MVISLEESEVLDCNLCVATFVVVVESIVPFATQPPPAVRVRKISRRFVTIEVLVSVCSNKEGSCGEFDGLCLFGVVKGDFESEWLVKRRPK